MTPSRTRTARVMLPFVGSGAPLHLCAAEIANELRALLTDPGAEHGLRLFSIDVGGSGIVIELAGTAAAVDHWLDGRLPGIVEATIESVLSRRRSRPRLNTPS